MKKQLLQGAAAAALLLTITLASCENPAGTEKNGQSETLRYETIPYVPAGRAARAAASLDNLVYSAYDNSRYYYVFLLGHVNRVPISFRPAIQYDGVTPVTIGYSMSDFSEESIEDSVENASENSTTESMSLTWGVEAGMTAGGDTTGFEASFKASAGGSTGWDRTSSRSTTNTVARAQSWGKDITDSFEVTIGEHDEGIGLYRYSLFTTTDVYAVVITNKQKTTIEKSYTAICARPNRYWAVDYEPDEAGDFGKTASGELLTHPEFTISELPNPENEGIELIPPAKAATPTASAGTGSYEVSVSVSLSCSTPGAAIYYTTNGTTPTASSSKYSAPITITTDTTLKAIAVASDMDDSDVLTRTYTITEQSLQTVWTFSKYPNESQAVHCDDGPWTDVFFNMNNAANYVNFDKSRLQAAGYNSIKINASFRGREIHDGRVEARIKAGDGNGAELAHSGDKDLPGEGTGLISFEATKALSNFLDTFTVQLHGYGGGPGFGFNTSEYNAWDIKVTFTAVK